MGRRLIAAALAMAATCAAAAETLRLAPGQSAVFVLVENPSTGYSWEIDPKASAGLDRLQISDDGYKAGADMPGAPGKHAWTIRALSPGKATVAFVYRRPWEPAPVGTRRLGVVVGAR